MSVIVDLMKNDPNRVVIVLDHDKLFQVIAKLDKMYFNDGQSPLTDAEYDRFMHYVRNKYPNDPYFSKTGSLPRDTGDVRATMVSLPHLMPSLEKIYPDTSDYTRWLSRFSRLGAYCVVSDKLDGEGIMLIYTASKVAAFTRGDGKTGRNVTHILRHVPVPRPSSLNIKGNERVVVRGELILSKAGFAALLSKTKNDPTQKSYKNSRAALVGSVNRASGEGLLKSATFVAHELLVDGAKTTDNYTMSHQMKALKAYKFEIPEYKIFKLSDLSDPNILREYLTQRKLKAKYDMDGLVITPDATYKRGVSESVDRPSYMVAFKDNHSSEQKMATVTDVVWAITRTGVFAPRVMIQPTSIAGSTITYLTGFNAFFIEHGYPYKNRDSQSGKKPIGPGAVIRIVKSGDVIPYIMEVVKPAKEAKLPNQRYVYDSKGVNIQPVAGGRNAGGKNQGIDDKLKSDIAVRAILFFFQTIGAMYVGESLVKKMVAYPGFKLPVFLKYNPDKIQEVLGLSSLMADKIYKSIRTGLKNSKLEVVIAATGMLGRGIGSKKIKDLLTNVPALLTYDPDTMNEAAVSKLIDKVQTTNGISIDTAAKIVSNLSKIRAFLLSIEVPLTYVRKTVVTGNTAASNKLSKITVVFSKIRDKEVEQYIEQHGGTVASSVSKSVTHLVVGSLSDTSTKIEKAKAYGVVILTLPDFKKLFMH